MIQLATVLRTLAVAFWIGGMAMLVCVAVQAAYLTPAIARVSAGLDFVHRTPGDPRYAAIRPLHSASAGLETVVLAGGIAALAGWALGGKP